MGSMSSRSSTNHQKKKRKHKANSKNFIIDLNTVHSVGKTTLYIRNIPNRSDKPMMMKTIDKNYAGKFDFFYLPIDFKVRIILNPNPQNQCNVGYAFINFTSTEFIEDFYLEFNNKRWKKFNSDKVPPTTPNPRSVRSATLASRAATPSWSTLTNLQ